MFAPIFEDIFTLKLLNGYHLTYSTIVMVQLKDIWGRTKPSFIQVMEHDHKNYETDCMWHGCFRVRKTLAEVYGTEPMYNTHSLISPQV